MKSNKGITLVTLIVIVAVLIIIVSVSISTGIDALNSTRLKGFYTQLEIVQKRVDDISSTNEFYINESGNEIYLSETGTARDQFSEEQKNKLDSIIMSEGGNPLDNYVLNFRYFTKEQLKTILGIEKIDYNLFINFEERIILAEEGITINDKTYYMLQSTTYFVEENLSKNEEKINSLIYGAPIQYTADTYKLSIEPENPIGDLDKTGYIKYKETISNYWDVTNDKYIIIKLETEYNIVYTDLNQNKIEKKIKIEYKKDEQGNLIQDDEGKNILTVTEVTNKESEEL